MEQSRYSKIINSRRTKFKTIENRITLLNFLYLSKYKNQQAFNMQILNVNWNSNNQNWYKIKHVEQKFYIAKTETDNWTEWKINNTRRSSSKFLAHQQNIIYFELTRSSSQNITHTPRTRPISPFDDLANSK